MQILRKIFSFLKFDKSDNWKIVVLCLVTATIFWFFNALNKNYSANIKYPIEFLYDKDLYQAIEIPPEDVLINLEGVGWNLLRKSLGIKVDPLQIKLEAPGESKKIPGNVLPAVISDQIKDLQLNFVITDTLFINFDYKITKRLFLKIDSSDIILEPNYYITSPISLSYDTIVLTGPKRILDAMSDTLFISLKDQNIDDDYNEKLTVEFESDHLFIKTPTLVNVQFSVRKFSPFTVQVPLKTLNNNKYTLIDSVLSINYYLPEEVNDTLPENSFQGIVDFASLSKNDSTITPRLSAFPPLTKNISISPEKLRFIRHE